MAKRSRTKSKPRKPPARFHLDKRAAHILADSKDADDDELLTTRQLAAWLGVSEQFLEIARSDGYGPEFVMISSRRIAYQRPAVRAWLKERTFSHTAQYAERPAPKRRTQERVR